MSATKRALPSPPTDDDNRQKPKYEKLSLHAQILLRPDTYIGSVKGVKSVDPVWVAINSKITKAEVECNEGLTRVFIEVLSNAIDNVWRSVEKGHPPKLIKVDLTPTSCRIWNDGLNIPTGQHTSEKIPTPELIFGHLLTSSNYNDAEERKTSGRNGYGVKLANIFSSAFTVEIYNKEEKVKYTQNWTGNMKVCGTPSLVAVKSMADKDNKNGFTCVTWTPDFARFGCECFSEDMLSVLKKSVYDCAMTVSIHKVAVVLNGDKIAMAKLTDYVQMYECCAEPTLCMQSSDCFVVLAPASEYTCVSFVNGIFTRDGGVHVDKWVEAAFRPIADKMKGKIGDLRDIKKYFFVFVFATLDKPTFDTQSKNRLNGPAVAVDVKPAHISKLLKWDFIGKIEQSHKLKEMLSFQKETERKKKNVVVEGLDDANFAGKANKNCVLTITEGLSARTYVIAGMKYGFGPYKGRDTIGVLPIRGKFVNVKNASTDLLKKNKELIGITQALGLVYNLDYSLNENFTKLRYKKLMVICDADTDGSHILGLLYNLFHTLYPTLLDRLGFFCFMRVPIVKIGAGATVTNYYHYEQAKKVLEAAPGSAPPVRGPVRYFKGLGTSRDEDIKNDFGKRIVHLQRDDGANQMMTNVFDTEETEFRKQWLQAHVVKTEFPTIKDGEIEVLTVSDFLNHELILYSIDHCKRSIPSLVDGLKESTRKVLFGAIKKNLRFAGESMKVAQFANYVAEKTNYHHGEMNLYDTVIKMAQRFVGSNNIPLFYNDGQFGSRLENGKDASDGRYIFTKLEACTRLIFRPEDDDYLVIRKDDGDEVEPVVYFPIVPMILVNGCTGSIGTGWSSTILPHSVKDLAEWIRCWLDGQDPPTLVPFYKGFKGVVRVIGGSKVITEGVVTLVKDAKYVVTELPIGKKMLSISKYKEKLVALEEAGVIKGIDNQSTENAPSFAFTLVTPPPAIGDGGDGETLLDKLGLTDTNYTSNMVLFDAQGKLKKYATAEEIMQEWCLARFEQYNKRKAALLQSMQQESSVLYNRIRFIEMVLDGNIVMKNKDEEMLVKELKALKFELGRDGYDYLLNTPIKMFTSKHTASLRAKYTDLVAATKALAAKPIKDIWLGELKEMLEKCP